MPIDFRKTRWILIVIGCVLAGIYSWYYFPVAFPILDIDISMDRKEAIEKARRLARRRGLGPENFHTAASFSQDNEVQTFVELEAGGKDAFREMMRTGRYYPFQWHVRLYREGQTRETTIRFKPNGDLYGFIEKWPESVSGPALSSEKAQQLAERQAKRYWNVDLSRYKFLSSGQQKQPSNRLDHTFIYERKKVDIGDGEYRLRLRVSGDQLSQVTHSVKVPQAFNRKYKNMRSANKLIQSAGNIFVYVLYLLVGCLFGSYWLVTRDALKWRTALVWGTGITVLLFLTEINSIPLSWMNYDTALSTGGFLSQKIINALSSSLFFGAIITVSLMGAEGLTREAFGHHPKLWRTWNPKAAGSKTISRLTVFAYLLLGPYFAYNVALYAFAHESLGWWTPSNILYNPNVLAHYVAWLKPVVDSLRAGFWEECLFRAVPLAGAALLGSRFGRRNWWIGATLVLQALVFGAGHASYATQPSYARVVELFFSSIGLGMIYLIYGLLPTVIAHSLYDLILMSLPIFAASTSGVWLSKSLVVLMGSVPLLVVIYGWFVNGRLIDLPETYFNRVRSSGDEEGTKQRSLPVPPGLSSGRVGLVVLAGIIGAGCWFAYGNFNIYETPLGTNRVRAVNTASSMLERSGQQPADWTTAATKEGSVGVADRFVWQEAGPDVYGKLMGSFLEPPHWRIRFFTFRGSLVERAEEYRVRLAPETNFRELQHVLPKSAEGDSLSESRARTIADSAVVDAYDYSISNLKRLSAKPQPRPNRRDWTFEYAVPKAYPLQRGQARIRIRIAGSEITERSRYVHVPESWQRKDRSRRTIIDLVTTFSDTILYLLALVGAFVGLVMWGRNQGFDGTAFVVVFVGFLVLVVLRTANQWPRILASVSTAEPFWSQVATSLIDRVFSVLWAGVLALVAGFSQAAIGSNKSSSLLKSILVGISLGALAVGGLALLGQFTPDIAPQWGSYQSLDAAVPLAHHALDAVHELVISTVMLLLFAAGVHHLSRAGQYHTALTMTAVVLFGVVVASHGNYSTLIAWGYRSVFFGMFFLMVVLSVFPNDRSFLPVAVGSFLVFQQLKIIFTGSHFYALVSPLLAILLLFATSIYWTDVLQQRQTK